MFQKKAKYKDLAGKKLTMFNLTKFITLQDNLRQHQATIVDYEMDKEENLQHEEESESLTKDSQI